MTADMAYMERRIRALERHFNSVFGTAFPLDGGNDAFNQERSKDQASDDEKVRQEESGESVLRQRQQGEDKGSASAKEMSKPILSVDFDGVLHSYTSGWKDAITANDPPVSGAYEFLLEAVQKFNVYVFSSRSNVSGGRECMFRYCKQHFPLVYLRLYFPEHKPPALVTLDDRCVCFTGTFPDVGELRAFKPWNKK